MAPSLYDIANISDDLMWEEIAYLDPDLEIGRRIKDRRQMTEPSVLAAIVFLVVALVLLTIIPLTMR